MHTWWQLLASPCCKAKLEFSSEHSTCSDCQGRFPFKNGVPQLQNNSRDQSFLAGTDGQQMVRAYRQPSRVAAWLRRLITSEYFPGKAWRRAKQATLQQEPNCLILGSGITRYSNAIHMDLDDFDGVDLIADAHRIPFADSTLDGVVCEVVLEHVSQPTHVVAETLRVLKPGAACFFIVPFLFPYHGHPNDYRRWSQEGLKTDFGRFELLDVGIHAGPCSAMVNLLSEWAYVLSGFTFPKAYVPVKGAATALLFPLKFLDTLVNRFPEAHRLSATLFVHAQKPRIPTTKEPL